MADKTVLVIAYYFPPMGLSGVQRTAKFVKYLPEFGWNAIVLSCDPKSYYAYDSSLMEELDNDDIEIIRASSNPGKEARKRNTRKFPNYFIQKTGRAVLQTIYQPDSKIKWKKYAVEAGEKIIQEHDVNAIFATAPPFTDFLVARDLSDKYKIPFVVDYRDIWVDNPFHFYATPFHKNYSIRLESEILTKSEKAVVITRQAKETLLKRYRLLSHSDISIIPHGFDPQDFQFEQPVLKDPSKFVITHSGLFQDDRTPKYFLKALKNFLDSNKEAAYRLEAKFVGLMRPAHEKMIRKMKLENNVSITGYLTHKDAVRELLKSDVLWLTFNDTVRTPGKLYEYFGARKPIIILSPDGAMRQIAMESGAAFPADPKDIKLIEKHLKKLFKLWQEKLLPKPSEDFAKNYDRRLLTEKLAIELSHIAQI